MITRKLILVFICISYSNPASKVVFLGTLNKQLAICVYDKNGELDRTKGNQAGCYNLSPVFDWIRHCIISIFLVFFIAFLPLFLQGMVVQ